MTSNQPSSSSSSSSSQPSSAPSTQNKKTIEFWNDLYQKDPSHHKEWILHPSIDLFQRLVEALPITTSDSDNPLPSHVNILEIGCGTSTLSRDFWRYCRQEHTHLSVSVMATDVSQVCIEQNKTRDQEELQIVLQGEQARLEYRVLNIAEPLVLLDTKDDEDTTDNAGTRNAIHTSRIQPKSFDMILDKGCLDTFAFRSRQRGDQKDALVQSVLNNVIHLLKDGSDNDDNNQFTSTGGVYVIVSPRAKFRMVQNYPGFAKVLKIPLGVGEIKADLMESNAYSNSHNNSNITTGSQSRPPTAKKERDTLYMYVCSKLQGYNPQQIRQPSTTGNMVPDDADICPACGIAFRDFRKGEDVKGRGAKYWTRMFRGHVRHCKG